LLRERVEAMKAIWTQDEAEYHGDLVDFDPIYMWPKPVQKPHPPIHVGGGFPGGARRAIRYGDGWMPIGGRDGDIAERLPQFREMAREAGRDPETLEVSVFAAEASESALARHRDAGISRVVLMLPPAPCDEILPILDNHAGLMDSVD
jgi:alkanesulfonate monooxygenase SsuD/methylene tetrahydromethanopterin reductase-like flavin-dependent oxidoreductase (luciferase family)